MDAENLTAAGVRNGLRSAAVRVYVRLANRQRADPAYAHLLISGFRVVCNQTVDTQRL